MKQLLPIAIFLVGSSILAAEPEDSTEHPPEELLLQSERSEMQRVELWDGLVLYAKSIDEEKASGYVLLWNSLWDPAATNKNRYTFQFARALEATFSKADKSLVLQGWPLLWMDRPKAKGGSRDSSIHFKELRFHYKGLYQAMDCYYREGVEPKPKSP